MDRSIYVSKSRSNDSTELGYISCDYNRTNRTSHDKNANASQILIRFSRRDKDEIVLQSHLLKTVHFIGTCSILWVETLCERHTNILSAYIYIYIYIYILRDIALCSSLIGQNDVIHSVPWRDGIIFHWTSL